MKLAITLPAALLATTALADMKGTDHIQATELMGNSIYTSSAPAPNEWTMLPNDARIADLYQEIGGVEDILFDGDGQIVGIVAEVGGFLDIGDKHVMLPMEDLRLVQSGEEHYFVTWLTAERLEERQAFDVGMAQ